MNKLQRKILCTTDKLRVVKYFTMSERMQNIHKESNNYNHTEKGLSYQKEWVINLKSSTHVTSKIEYLWHEGSLLYDATLYRD
jgi:hypothetical protein